MNKIVTVIIFLGLAVGILLIPGKSNAFLGLWGSKYQEVQAADGVVRLPLDQINDGAAHYYSYKDQGFTINFFVLKSSDGVIRAAFDACDVCFPQKKGYTQSGDYMICNNCGQKFHSAKINVIKGGCNPAPLRRGEQNGYLVITANDIMAGYRYF